MKHVFIFDPKSFREQQWMMDSILDRIGQFFRTQDKPDFSIQISRYRRDALGLIQKEADTTDEYNTVRVYAIGGEDILFDCLNGVAELPNAELAAVPYGVKSDFLRNFGEGKEEQFKDIPSLVQANTVPTDIINLDGIFALNSCLIGLKTAAATKAKPGKGFISRLSGITNYMNYLSSVFDKETAAQYYKITIENRDFSGNYSIINIVNGPYFAGKKVGISKAAPDDGLLDIMLIKAADPLKTLWSVGRYFRGKTSSNCVHLQAENISINSDKPMSIKLDNEFFQDTKINLNVLPQALQMVAVNNLSYKKQ
jgi:diacylglycerol kinase family enzyme